MQLPLAPMSHVHRAVVLAPCVVLVTAVKCNIANIVLLQAMYKVTKIVLLNTSSLFFWLQTTYATEVQSYKNGAV